MSILFLILPLTLVLSSCAVAAFAWATRSGQFDDLETPALRLLHEPEHVKQARVADAGPDK
jgi:cbb3-type cytochrome oxidase maturation protein